MRLNMTVQVLYGSMHTLTEVVRPSTRQQGWKSVPCIIFRHEKKSDDMSRRGLFYFLE